MTGPDRCESHGAPLIGRLDTFEGSPMALLWADGCLAWLRDPNGLGARDHAAAVTAAEVAAAVVDASIAEVASIAAEYRAAADAAAMAATDAEDGAW